VTVLPAGTQHLLERNMRVYKRWWKVIVSGFFEPVFYLFAMGVGLGRLVGEVALPSGQAVTYTEFIAPALLAASAMNGGVYESTMNVFFKLRYGKIYDAVLATPVRAADIALGEIMWSQLRGTLYAVGFLAVMAAMGLVTMPYGLLALPAAVLIGFAFAAVGLVATTFMTSWQHLDFVQLAIWPLFLFSATFFPLEVYPAAVQPLIQLSPLYHGVELVRGLTLGLFSWPLVGHAAVLVAMTAVGLKLAIRRISKLLLV
jgi:lipooligosaccharide transport system permease protein